MSTAPVPANLRKPLRIGITGSRKYGSPVVIRAALLAAHDRARPHEGHVLVHGQCDPVHPDTGRPVRWAAAKRLSWEVQRRLLGADWLCEQVALDMNAQVTWHIERFPAEWDVYQRAAGFRRNAAMVESGPFDEWEAFALPCSDHRCYRADPHPSHGTAHCAGLAEKAGIPVMRFTATGPVADPRNEEYEHYAYGQPGIRL